MTLRARIARYIEQQADKYPRETARVLRIVAGDILAGMDESSPTNQGGVSASPGKAGE